MHLALALAALFFSESFALAEEPVWSVHAQATAVSQAHPRFPALYSSATDLDPGPELRSSFTSTLFAGARTWRGGELFVNPELAGGRGFSNVFGIAGFPNGEIYRVGNPNPRVYVSRVFARQTIGLGGPSETLADGWNRVESKVHISRVTVTAGKFSVDDVFDGNSYAHDPRSQFLNWALVGLGSWDYPADTRGYTWGVAVELNQERWTLRAAETLVARSANGPYFDLDVARAHASVVEAEGRYELGSRQGVARLLAFLNNARMGSYEDALAAAPRPPDVIPMRDYRSKYGFGVNLEQKIRSGLGVFSRLGWSDGRNESWMFTEIDRTAAAGLQLEGGTWGRQADALGLAWVTNWLAKPHKDYLAAGGVGFILGDGALNYAPEDILEIYYRFTTWRFASLTADYQEVWNPGYNQDRGPALIFALRLHAEL